jgi:hypothetical protein
MPQLGFFGAASVNTTLVNNGHRGGIFAHRSSI